MLSTKLIALMSKISKSLLYTYNNPAWPSWSGGVNLNNCPLNFVLKIFWKYVAAEWVIHYDVSVFVKFFNTPRVSLSFLSMGRTMPFGTHVIFLGSQFCGSLQNWFEETIGWRGAFAHRFIILVFRVWRILLQTRFLVWSIILIRFWCFSVCGREGVNAKKKQYLNHTVEFIIYS